MSVGGHWKQIGRYRNRSWSIVGAHDEERIAGGIEVEETELERDLLPSASVNERQARPRLVVHVELREPELAEL